MRIPLDAQNKIKPKLVTTKQFFRMYDGPHYVVEKRNDQSHHEYFSAYKKYDKLKDNF
jgi:hypothetical protein